MMYSVLRTQHGLHGASDDTNAASRTEYSIPRNMPWLGRPTFLVLTTGLCYASFDLSLIIRIQGVAILWTSMVRHP